MPIHPHREMFENLECGLHTSLYVQAAGKPTDYFFLSFTLANSDFENLLLPEPFTLLLLGDLEFFSNRLEPAFRLEEESV